MQMSEHTRLINKFIGLCDNGKHWPSILYTEGYRVKLIEQTLRLHSGNDITPDVIAASNRHSHMLVVDCKSGGNINPDQESRYTMLTLDVLLLFVSVPEESKATYKPCYVDQGKHHARLKEHSQLPFITFGDDAMYGDGDFGNEHLNHALCQRILLGETREPTGYYPFSYSDPDQAIAPYVLRGLVTYANTARRMGGRDAKSAPNGKNLVESIHKYHRLLSTKHKLCITD